VIQNQILRAPIVLLERSISGRKHGHVTVREGGIGHLTGFQELVKLQQKNGIWFYSPLDSSHLSANRCYQLTRAWYMWQKKKGKRSRHYILCARPQSRTLDKIKQSLAVLKGNRLVEGR